MCVRRILPRAESDRADRVRRDGLICCRARADGSLRRFMSVGHNAQAYGED